MWLSRSNAFGETDFRWYFMVLGEFKANGIITIRLHLRVLRDLDHSD